MPKPEDSGKPEGASESKATKGASAGASRQTETDAISLLKQDHRKVEQLFDKAEGASGAQKEQLIDDICTELIIHTLLEERLFYPACRQPSTDQLLDEAQVEHDCAKVLICELMDGRNDEYRDAKLKVLSEEIRTHINEEEAPDGVMAKAQKAGVNTLELGERLMDLKQRLQEASAADRLPSPRPVALHELSRLADEMTRGRPAYRRYRDEETGRGYRSDDERRYGRQGSDWGEYGRRSYGVEDEERRYGARPWDERDYGRRSFRGDDDERRYGRGRGGWYGDPQGHAEAARRGWDEREGRRSYRDEDEDRRYGRERGQGGWDERR